MVRRTISRSLPYFDHAGLPQNIAVHVPFVGLAPALMALLSGNAQFMITSTGAATARIASGMQFDPREGGIAACIQRHRDERGNLALPAQSLPRARRNPTPGWSPFVNSTPARIRTFSIIAKVLGSPA